MDQPLIRRRQIDRSTETKALLIEAAIECLRSAGFSGASTAAIARRARVTTGALHHHFSTKDDLMIGVLDHCNTRVGERLQLAEPTERTADIDMPGLVQHLWEVYGDPEYWAIWEIIIGTRADDEFHRRIIAHRLQTMRSLLYPWVEHRGFAERNKPAVIDLFEFMLIAIRGLSLERFLDKDPVYFKRHLDLLAELVSAKLKGLSAQAEAG